MGLLIKGQWHNDWYDTESNGGEFIRQDSQIRGQIGDSLYPAESDRYHLFVSLACPWAHRTLIFRALKGLQSVIGATVVKPEMMEQGWEIDDQVSIAASYEANPVENINYLQGLYTKNSKEYTGRVTVPVLWDKQSNTIVNNESADIIRMLNSAFNSFTNVKSDYYPEALRSDIDTINHFVYDNINNGVYKAGFATTQKAYEKSVKNLFDALDRIEDHLSRHHYLVGERQTEADWRLFTTLIRFDSVYYGHFKTNLRMIEHYPNLSNYLRDLYQHPGIAATVNFDHIKTHYYTSHDTINPTRIIPIGPDIKYRRPHNRNRLEKSA